MTRMVRVEGNEYHAVPSQGCATHGVGCHFRHRNCNRRLHLCAPNESTLESVAFIHPDKYPTWLANRIRGVE